MRGLVVVPTQVQHEDPIDGDESEEWEAPEHYDDSEGEGAGVGGPMNTTAIVGPTGGGKTALVYAAAEKMGFGVIEVNTSQVRSAAGRCTV